MVVYKTKDEMIEERMNRVLTQYRESPKLLFLIRTYLEAVFDVASLTRDMPLKFYINTAVGDQLTLLGKRLGWPRRHCVCETQPVAGFECEGVIEPQPVSGFCDDMVTWLGCGVLGSGEIEITDDELYRKFLKVRIYQIETLFDIDSLSQSLQILWGDTGFVLDAGLGRVVVSPGRDLTDSELAVLQLYPRVLPVAPGIEVRFHFDDINVAGFGDGWGGFCEPFTDGALIETYDGATRGNLATAGGDDIITTALTNGAPWMCEIDVKPYTC